MLDISKLIDKIAETEKKYKDSKAKKESKYTPEFYRNYFCKVFLNTYSVGYVPKITIDRAIFAKLMKSYEHGFLIKLIDKFVTEYRTIKGVNLRDFPRPSTTGLQAFANSVAAMIEIEKGDDNDYQETDGLTF